MRELHKGICILHTGGSSLATKVVRTSYYWPTLRADALDFTKRCQEFADILHTPLDNLYSLSSPCPFAMWVTTKGPGSSQIFTNCYRLLHQVDWGKTTMRNHSERGWEVHLEIPHMQVWPPLCHCHRQWHLIQSSGLWRLPNKARHKAPRNLCWTSLDQRSSRGNQQSHP